MTKIEGGEVAIIVALAYWDKEPYSGQKRVSFYVFLLGTVCTNGVFHWINCAYKKELDEKKNKH